MYFLHLLSCPFLLSVFFTLNKNFAINLGGPKGLPRRRLDIIGMIASKAINGIIHEAYPNGLGARAIDGTSGGKAFQNGPYRPLWLYRYLNPKALSIRPMESLFGTLVRPYRKPY